MLWYVQRHKSSFLVESQVRKFDSVQGLKFGSSASQGDDKVQFWRLLFRRLISSLKRDEEAKSTFSSFARQATMQTVTARLADFFGSELMPWLLKEQRLGRHDGSVYHRVAVIERTLRLALASIITE